VTVKNAVLGVLGFACFWIALEEWYAGVRSWLFLAAVAFLVFVIVCFLVVYLPNTWRQELEEHPAKCTGRSAEIFYAIRPLFVKYGAASWPTQ